MVHIERTLLAKIRRAAVYENTRKLTLRQIVAEQQPDIALTAAFYDPGDWKPVCPVKKDGRVLFADRRYHYWAIAWDKGEDAAAVLVPPGGNCGKANYVANCVLASGGKAHEKLYYNKDVGGRRGRVAVGLAGDTWVTYGATDGSSGARTPEELRNYMVDKLGCGFAVMMDGGGKVNLYVRSANVMMQGRAPSQTLILLWLENEEEKPMEAERKRVCLDAGHSAGNKVNKSPDGTFYEHEFALDMAKRMKGILERHGVTVTETRPDGRDVSLGERCRIANAVEGLDLFVSLHSNATGTLSTGPDGWGTARGWMAYLYAGGGAGQRAAEAVCKQVRAAGVTVRKAPFAYDPGLYVLKHTAAPAVLIEHGFHTSREDVALMKNAAYREKLAAAESRGILEYLGIRWQDPGDRELEEAVDTLAAARIIDSPDRWRQLEYTEKSVRALLIKMAAAVKGREKET